MGREAYAGLQNSDKSQPFIRIRTVRQDRGDGKNPPGFFESMRKNEISKEISGLPGT
jgi:hypothetical protein